MGLSSLQLDAFFAAARARNFSRAAKELCITQSALTQRISNLENDIGISLFVRKPRGVEPTEAGERLLRYCQTRDLLERELMESLSGKGDHDTLGGALRIAGYSSVARSVLLPALMPLMREHPKMALHLENAEIRDLPGLLFSGEVDFLVLDHPLTHADLETVQLGQEELVLIESRDHPVREDVYLEHDPEDPSTIQYFQAQGSVPELRRCYLDEIYALIDGAALGMGRAVVSKHLVAEDPRLRILDAQHPVRLPVLLHFFKQSFHSQLQRVAVEALQANCPKFLS